MKAVKLEDGKWHKSDERKSTKLETLVGTTRWKTTYRLRCGHLPNAKQVTDVAEWSEVPEEDRCGNCERCFTPNGFPKALTEPHGAAKEVETTDL